MSRISPRSVAPLLALLVLVGVSGLPGLVAENWPQWRGPNGDGTSSEKGLPSEWSREKNVAWRLALPGPAGSTPAVWGDRIFLTTVDGKDINLLCISTAGTLRWTRKLAKGNKAIRKDEGNYSSPSPSTDGERIWVFTGTGDLSCHDIKGTILWKKNLQQVYGEYDHWHGMANTPLVVDGVLYQMCIQMKDPYVLALDALSGKERWKVSRASDAKLESRQSYASPVLYRDGKTQQLLIHGGDYTTAHDLENGDEIWRVGHLNARDNYNEYLRFVASPVCRPGLIVVPSAKGRPVLGVSPDGKGMVKKSDLLWFRGRDTTDVPTPAIHDGIVYLLRENGVLITMDAASGEEIYQDRVHRTRQRASPVVADGKVYIAARDGVVYVLAAGRKFKVEATNAMGEPISSTPAIANGRIYLRTFKALYAIEKPAK